MPDESIVIADTSCLIILKSIDEFDLLKKIFGRIIITPKVAEEFGKQLPEWIHIVKSNDNLSKALSEIVDEGEASSIALALEPDNDDKCLLLLDDLRARKLAKQLGLRVTGTIGVIAKAEKTGKLNRGMDIIEKIQKTNFRLSDKIIDEISKELKK